MNAFDFPALLTLPTGSRIVSYARLSLLDRALALLDRGVARFADLLDAFAAAFIRKVDDVQEWAVREMGHEIAGAMTLADLIARAAIARKVDAAVEKQREPQFVGGGPPTGPPPDDFGAEPDEGEPRSITVEINAGMEEVPNIANRDAIAEIVARTPRLALPVAEGGPRWLQVAKMYEEQGFALARSTALEVTERAQKHVADYLRGGKTMEQAAAAVGDMTASNQAYGETVIRTNAATAFSGGLLAQIREPEEAYHFPALERQSVRDSSTRPNHRAAHGLIAAPDDPVMKLWMPPSGYNCFPGNTLVSGRFVGGLKTWYSGPAVEIKTRSGKRLTVTVNHPVLRVEGWVRAGSLREGDHLLCHGAGVELLVSGPGNGRLAAVLERPGAVDNQDTPACIEDVFDALRHKAVITSGAGARVPVHPNHLYGDAEFTEGEIEIVGSTRNLPADTNGVGGFDGVHEFEFVLAESSSSPGHRLGARDPLVNRVESSCGGAPRRGALPSADVGVVRPRSQEFPLHPLRIGLGSDLRARSSEVARQSGAADTEFIRELHEAGAGVVTQDEVVEVWYHQFTGHVFDLESEGGWILAGGIYTSNCRCTVRPVGRAFLESKGLLNADGSVRPYYPPAIRSQAPDPGFGHTNFVGASA